MIRWKYILFLFVIYPSTLSIIEMTFFKLLLKTFILSLTLQLVHLLLLNSIQQIFYILTNTVNKYELLMLLIVGFRWRMKSPWWHEYWVDNEIQVFCLKIKSALGSLNKPWWSRNLYWCMVVIEWLIKLLFIVTSSTSALAPKASWALGDILGSLLVTKSRHESSCPGAILE